MDAHPLAVPIYPTVSKQYIALLIMLDALVVLALGLASCE
jgi:hypothetical protein